MKKNVAEQFKDLLVLLIDNQLKGNSEYKAQMTEIECSIDNVYTLYRRYRTTCTNGWKRPKSRDDNIPLSPEWFEELTDSVRIRIDRHQERIGGN